MAISRDVRALSAESDRINRMFASRHQLSNNDLDALLHIIVADSAGRPLTSGELSDRLGFTAAAATYLVDRMVDSGHIRRESHPTDRRKVILRYSEHGQEVAGEFFGPLGKRHHAAMAHISDADLATAHRVFTALAESMNSFHADITSATSE